MQRHVFSGPQRILKQSLLSALLIMTAQASFAATINITTNQVINTPTKYKNDTLNMSAGFIIAPGGSLTIENSTINVQTSPSNPFFTHMTAGNMTLKNNTVNVKTSGLTSDPSKLPAFELIQVDQGVLNIDHNFFAVNQPYALGFIKTNITYATSGLKVTQNVIKNFHGGIYLLNSYVALVEDNTFWNVSLSNILNTGTTSVFRRNSFFFPGNLQQGNAFDIINSADVVIAENLIASSAGNGIHIIGGDGIKIRNNKIMDGLAYAISIEEPVSAVFAKYSNVKGLGLKPAHNKQGALMFPNRNIRVTDNYIGQNRYGLTAQRVDRLTVKNNTFLQRFNDAAARNFYTNNLHLLTDVTDLVWNGNFYKEAFTQEVPGDNTTAKQFVTFPETGGVTL